MTTQKLFHATSTLDHGEEEVTFTWLRHADRKHPVADYRELINGYEKASPAQRAEWEGRVNQLLTDEELDELSRYVKDEFGLDVCWEEVSLPARLEDLREPDGDAVLELWKEDDYPLPFRVDAYRLLDHEPEEMDLEIAPQD